VHGRDAIEEVVLGRPDREPGGSCASVPDCTAAQRSDGLRSIAAAARAIATSAAAGSPDWK
jgi:hypothetical protein